MITPEFVVCFLVQKQQSFDCHVPWQFVENELQDLRKNNVKALIYRRGNS
jgi:hypothetical protein